MLRPMGQLEAFVNTISMDAAAAAASSANAASTPVVAPEPMESSPIDKTAEKDEGESVPSAMEVQEEESQPEVCCIFPNYTQ